MIFQIVLLWLMAAMAAFGAPHELTDSDKRPHLSCGSPYSQDILDAIDSFNFSSIDLGALVSSNTTDIDSAILRAIRDSNPNLGAADAFSNVSPKPWPRSATGTVVVWYCYRDAQTKQLMKNTMDAAISLWYQGLGGPKSRETGHALTFAERRGGPGSTPQLCTSGNQWNNLIPYDTLSLFWEVGPPGASRSGATAGFTSDPTRPWTMRLYLDRTDPVTAAHELGHVLGLIHEHQRSDRDYYIRVNYMEMPGFPEALAAAQQQFPGLTLEQFSQNYILGRQFNSRHGPYVKGITEDAKQIISRGQYDISSIMHYSTWEAANDECEDFHINKCAVVKYVNPAAPSPNDIEEIHENRRVSRGDAAWVRFTYPF